RVAVAISHWQGAARAQSPACRADGAGRSRGERMNELIDLMAEAPEPESRSHDDHDALRLWLRLFTCTMLIEGRVRAGLRERFATTLPRFDLMSQLERAPEGLKMGELSRRMMVTGGNVTGITTALVAEGLIERRAIPGDRRAQLVRLTAEGKRA